MTWGTSKNKEVTIAQRFNRRTVGLPRKQPPLLNSVGSDFTGSGVLNSKPTSHFHPSAISDSTQNSVHQNSQAGGSPSSELTWGKLLVQDLASSSVTDSAASEEHSPIKNSSFSNTPVESVEDKIAAILANYSNDGIKVLAPLSEATVDSTEFTGFENYDYSSEFRVEKPVSTSFYPSTVRSDIKEFELGGFSNAAEDGADKFSSSTNTTSEYSSDDEFYDDPRLGFAWVDKLDENASGSSEPNTSNKQPSFPTDDDSEFTGFAKEKKSSGPWKAFFFLTGQWWKLFR